MPSAGGEHLSGQWPTHRAGPHERVSKKAAQEIQEREGIGDVRDSHELRVQIPVLSKLRLTRGASPSQETGAHPQKLRTKASMLWGGWTTLSTDHKEQAHVMKDPI
jgi:hypothetical protein